MSAEDRYRALLLHAPDPILTIDRDARVISANPMACTTFGVTESTLMRTQILSRVPEEGRRDAAMALMRGFQGRVAEERIAMTCDRGVIRRFLVRIIPIPQRGGSPLVTLHLRDVSDAERVAEEGRRREHLERTPGQFLLTVETDGTIRHAHGLESALGYPDAEWVGQDLRELLEVGPERDPLLERMWSDLQEMGSWASIQRCVRTDGGRATVRMFATTRADPGNGQRLGCYLSGLVLPRGNVASLPNGTPIIEPPSAPTPREGGTATTLPIVAPDAPPSVMVIDDDATMRNVVRRFLERAGYSVREAFSGRNALLQLRDGAAVHFVVTDLKMPDGSGGWLVAQLSYEFPELVPRTVVITGEGDSTGTAHVAARWQCPVLTKPFSSSQLVNTLVRMAASEMTA